MSPRFIVDTVVYIVTLGAYPRDYVQRYLCSTSDKWTGTVR